MERTRPADAGKVPQDLADGNQPVSRFHQAILEQGNQPGRFHADTADIRGTLVVQNSILDSLVEDQKLENCRTPLEPGEPALLASPSHQEISPGQVPGCVAKPAEF